WNPVALKTTATVQVWLLTALVNVPLVTSQAIAVHGRKPPRWSLPPSTSQADAVTKYWTPTLTEPPASVVDRIGGVSFTRTWRVIGSLVRPWSSVAVTTTSWSPDGHLAAPRLMTVEPSLPT